eukprot:s1070_g5.t1
MFEESFVDLDLDLTELGGALTWTQALDDTQVFWLAIQVSVLSLQVTQYNVYLGIDCIENVSKLAENWTAVVVELVAAGVDSAVVATSLVVVNFARVTVQLVGVDQLPSLLPSFSTVFNVTNETDETEDDVVDIDNESSAVRTTSTTTESDAWLCKVEDDSEDSDADNDFDLDCIPYLHHSNVDNNSRHGGGYGCGMAALRHVNETDAGEDSDVPARRLSSVGSNATEVSDSQELIALLNFTRTRLIFCAQRELLGSVPVQSTTFDVPAETQKGNATHLLIYAASAYAESSIASGGTRVEDAEASVVNVSFADEDLDVSQLGGYIHYQSCALFHLLRRSFWSVFSACHLLHFRSVSELVDTFEISLGLSFMRWLNPRAEAFLYDYDHQRLCPCPGEAIKLKMKAREAHQSYDGGSDIPNTSTVLELPAVACSDFAFSEVMLDLRVQMNRWELLGKRMGLVDVTVSSRTTGLGLRVDGSQPASENQYGVSSIVIDHFPVLPPGSEVNTGVRNISVLPETDRGNYTHFLIYTRSSFAEQTNPAALAIFDANASVSNLRFEGKDLDLYDLGGDLIWDPPEDVSRVEAYAAYLARDADGEKLLHKLTSLALA